MTAVGRHYGSQVSLYSIWNEPNHPAFLQPQFNTNGTPASPRIYRALYQAGYAGLQAAGDAKPKMLIGETAPTGYMKGEHERERTQSPAARRRAAGLPARSAVPERQIPQGRTCTPLPAIGYAHHAYTTAPARSTGRRKDDVTIGVLSRLSQRARQSGRRARDTANLPIYLTEFGMQSKPNRFLGVSVAQQAEYDAIAEKIAWSNSRVAAFSQYLLRDDPLGGKPGSSVQRRHDRLPDGPGVRRRQAQAAVLRLAGAATVSKRGHGFSLWGLVRPATGATKLTVLVHEGLEKYRTLKAVTTNSLGYWPAILGQGARWRVRWGSPAGRRIQGPPIGATRLDGTAPRGADRARTAASYEWGRCRSFPRSR